MLTRREHEEALDASLGESLVTSMHEFRSLSRENLARRTGMPVARFIGEEEKRLAFTEDELDNIAAAVNVPVELLMD